MLNQSISPERRANVATRAISRRGFHRLASLLAARRGFAVLQRARPGPAFHGAQHASGRGEDQRQREPHGSVSRKPPKPFTRSCRMADATSMYETFTMASALAGQEGVKFADDPGRVTCKPLPDPAIRCIARSRLLFERPTILWWRPRLRGRGRAAQFIGAPVINVPLVKAPATHDVKAMAAAHPLRADLRLQSENPTGTITPKRTSSGW